METVAAMAVDMVALEVLMVRTVNENNLSFSAANSDPMCVNDTNLTVFCC